jgi:hypothetical protein
MFTFNVSLLVSRNRHRGRRRRAGRALFIAIGAGAIATSVRLVFGDAFLLVWLIIVALAGRLRRAVKGPGATMAALVRSALEGTQKHAGDWPAGGGLQTAAHAPAAGDARLSVFRRGTWLSVGGHAWPAGSAWFIFASYGAIATSVPS